jgi:predicted ATPase
LTVKYFAKKHYSIIIEEPEQNLFPKAQTETVKYIIEQVSEDNNLFLMTHSPYVLSTLNNLIFAYKVAQMSEKTKEHVKEFVKEEQWINPDNFSAYYLKDGIARNIVSKRGLISDNEIDDISDEMGDEFDTLMEIYREFKYAK